MHANLVTIRLASQSETVPQNHDFFHSIPVVTASDADKDGTLELLRVGSS